MERQNPLDQEPLLGKVKFKEDDCFVSTSLQENMESNKIVTVKIEQGNNELGQIKAVKIREADLSFSSTPLNINRKAEGHLEVDELSDPGFTGTLHYHYIKKPETFFSEAKEIFIRECGGFEEKVYVNKYGQIVQFEEG
ncbi:MAG: hypothetical protein ABRQ38_17400 [Candidatus Eremiobacterota bacterium]